MTAQEAWNQEIKAVTGLADKLGMPVDAGIIETVAIFRLLGINTIMSCAGHSERITNGPYIMFEDPEATAYRRLMHDHPATELGAQRAKNIRHKLYAVNLAERRKLLPHLEAFYQGRDTPYVHRLIIMDVSYKAGYLYCQGADLRHVVDQPAGQQILERNQQEMRDFTEFLKTRFFEDQPRPRSGRG